MKNNVVMLVILCTFYVLTLIYAAVKIKYIADHPERFDDDELQRSAEDKEDSAPAPRFFQSLSHRYSMFNLLFFLALTVCAYFLCTGCPKLLAGEHTSVTVGTQLAGVCAALFINIPLGMALIPLHIRTRFFAVSVLDFFTADRRSDMFRLAYLTFLILFALGFPFVALSCNNYIYYGESGITSSAYFQLDETFTAYADIEKVQIYVSHNKHGQPDQFHYDVALTDGRTVDINDSGTSRKYIASTTQEIHKYIAFYGSCTAEITPLNDDDIRYIETQLSAERAQAVYEVFGGFD